MTVTDFQERVYTALRQIPAGKVASYATLAKALQTSPRAVGGALRNNPFAPEVPCHRVISATGHIGGYMGDWHNAPSGINRDKKRELLREEGVKFDRDDKVLLTKDLWFDAFNVSMTFRTQEERSGRLIQSPGESLKIAIANVVFFRSYSHKSHSTGFSNFCQTTWQDASADLNLHANNSGVYEHDNLIINHLLIIRPRSTLEQWNI